MVCADQGLQQFTEGGFPVEQSQASRSSAAPREELRETISASAGAASARCPDPVTEPKRAPGPVLLYHHVDKATLLTYLSITFNLFIFLIFIVYGSIVDLQRCVPGIQQSGSVTRTHTHTYIYIYMYFLFQTLFPFRLYRTLLSRVPYTVCSLYCYTVGP